MKKTKKEIDQIIELLREHKSKIQYAIVLVDKAGGSVQLFHTRKLAEDFLKAL